MGKNVGEVKLGGDCQGNGVVEVSQGNRYQVIDGSCGDQQMWGKIIWVGIVKALVGRSCLGQQICRKYQSNG